LENEELKTQPLPGEAPEAIGTEPEPEGEEVSTPEAVEPSAESGGEDVSAPEITDNLVHVLEALLFASDEPLTPARIKEILNVNLDAREFRRMVSEINRKLQSDRRPFEIAEVAGGFQFRTIRAYHKYIKALFKDRAMRRLSGQALETLAIIAYKQPVSKAEIEGVRNVSTDTALKTLLEKRLIAILGKSEEKPGKPIVYGTTKDFLKYFGLSKISDLPKLEEIEEIAKAKDKTELIHDFKRDPEKTMTLPEAPVVKPLEAEAPAAPEAETSVPPAGDPVAPSSP
jgi:segregation and condensation protein B